MSQDELNLLAGASGIRIGPIANEQTGGGGMMGGTRWLKGSMVVTTLEGMDTPKDFFFKKTNVSTPYISIQKYIVVTQWFYYLDIVLSRVCGAVDSNVLLVW